MLYRASRQPSCLISLLNWAKLAFHASSTRISKGTFACYNSVDREVKGKSCRIKCNTSAYTRSKTKKKASGEKDLPQKNYRSPLSMKAYSQGNVLQSVIFYAEESGLHDMYQLKCIAIDGIHAHKKSLFSCSSCAPSSPHF